MSTAPVLDEREHRTALDTLIESTVGAGRVYSYGTVPGADGNAGSLPPIFVLLALERRFVPISRGVGLASRSGWRLSTRYVGRTVDEAAWAAFKVGEALDGALLAVDGHTSTPVQLESTQAIALDDGRFAGLALWTYSL